MPFALALHAHGGGLTLFAIPSMHQRLDVLVALDTRESLGDYQLQCVNQRALAAAVAGMGGEQVHLVTANDYLAARDAEVFRDAVEQLS